MLSRVFSLLVCFMHSINSVCVSVPISQFLLPLPLSPLGNYGFCAVLFDIDSGLKSLLLGITLGTLLENVTLLFSL